ncbi:MAG: hypothetical protein K2L46_05930, partial [Paramuribaculum sp.]|nr:hypothetical protein [Paramuribaculum sp.]
IDKRVILVQNLREPDVCRRVFSHQSIAIWKIPQGGFNFSDMTLFFSKNYIPPLFFQPLATHSV